METKARAFNPATVKTDCLIVVVPAKGQPGEAATAIDKAAGGLVATLRKDGELSKSGDTATLYGIGGIAARKLVLVCSGDKQPDTQGFLKLAEKIAAAAANSKSAAICLDGLTAENRDHRWGTEQLARVCGESLYRFDQCKSTKQPAPKLQQLTLHSASGGETAALNKALARGCAIARGVNLARELGDMPANLCTPTYLADRARVLAKGNDKLRTRVLSEKQMENLKMGSLLSVTAGSDTPAQFIIVEYKGAPNAKAAPHVLVGKGVTFDTGGISIKPGANMDEMKYDMCGAASVFGAIAAANELALPINIVGVVPAVENMPSGKATKPGDIVTSMSGQTIEVLNTDAEGRLILCDALTYVERYKPASVVDIATLTGACIIALGHHASGLFANNDELADKLLRSGEYSGDRAWRLPVWEDYNQQLKSNFADMANIGGRSAGSITAACFLSRFTKKYPWAHLDIAGTAWNSGANKGATGRPVPLLVDYLSSLGT